MLIPTIVMGVLAVGLLIFGYLRGGGEHVLGLKSAGNLLLQIAPLLIFAFIVAGMVQQLVSTEMISKWLGTESGIRGILIGTAMGAITPGGPYVSLPIAAGLLRVGSGVGTVVAYITGWSLIAVMQIPMQVGLLGWKVWMIRLVCTFFFPPIAGLIANALFSRTTVV